MANKAAPLVLGLGVLVGLGAVAWSKKAAAKPPLVLPPSQPTGDQLTFSPGEVWQIDFKSDSPPDLSAFAQFASSFQNQASDPNGAIYGDVIGLVPSGPTTFHALVKFLGSGEIQIGDSETYAAGSRSAVRFSIVSAWRGLSHLPSNVVLANAGDTYRLTFWMAQPMSQEGFANFKTEYAKSMLAKKQVMESADLVSPNRIVATVHYNTSAMVSFAELPGGLGRVEGAMKL